MNTDSTTPLVCIAMGSKSDLPVMEAAAAVLSELAITFELRVLSAHRTPHEMIAFGSQAAGRGTQVIIAGAGGAAHLPGMLAAVTTLPVIGVPVPLQNLQGLDSLLSIVQMPAGVPVATVAIGNAANAAYLAARILALKDPAIEEALATRATTIREQSKAADSELQQRASTGDATTADRSGGGATA